MRIFLPNRAQQQISISSKTELMKKESLGHFWAKETKGKILREQEELHYPTELFFLMLQHRTEVGANSLLVS